MRILFWGFICSLLSQVVLADRLSVRAPEELSWKTYDEVVRHALQSGDELLYQKVDWKSNVLDGQREGYKDDKPIVMILFFGDHRSNC